MGKTLQNRLLIFVACMTAAWFLACTATMDHGAGKCREYVPFMCGEGELYCETGKRGCVV